LKTFYNGGQKLQSESKFFMTDVDIVNYVISLKVKNWEGHKRIPHGVLIDHLINPLAKLIVKNYHTKIIPSQSKIAKVNHFF
jgi:hypothetical protein